MCNWYIECYNGNFIQHETPLKVAVANGNRTIVELLLEKGAEVDGDMYTAVSIIYMYCIAL